MFKRASGALARWLRRQIPAGIAMVVIAIVLAWVYLRPGDSNTTAGAYSPEKAAAYVAGLKVQEGAADAESVLRDGKTWFAMAHKDEMVLWFDPQQGQIAVENTRTHALWKSNPGTEELKKESAKGIPRSNLESPLLFVFNEGGSANNPTASNLLEQAAKVEWHSIVDGVGVRYTMEELGFVIYVEFTLKDGALLAHIPDTGISETGKPYLISLDLLPFFGAARNDADGYLLVPDGPGGLIRFTGNRQDQRLLYDYPVYGNDPAVPVQNDNRSRTPISYPVFGIKKEGAAVVGVIEEGEGKARIVAIPAGISTGFNTVHPRFELRRNYMQPSGLNRTAGAIEKKLAFEPVTVRYLFPEPAQSDYVGMAKAYRNYLLKQRGVTPLASSEGAPPLQLQIVVSSEESGALGKKMRIATTFDQAQTILEGLTNQGISAMDVTLSGWMNGGEPGYQPNRFPAESGAGGDAGLSKLIGAAHDRGIKLQLNDLPYMAVDRSGNGFSANKDAMRAITGAAIKQTGSKIYKDNAVPYYLISPDSMLRRYLPKALAWWKEWNIDGASLSGLGELLYSDFHPQHPVDRKTSMTLFTEMMDSVRQQLGRTSTSGGFAFMLGHADHMYDFPVEYNYDLLVDEQVPFYPIAVHGLVTYSTKPGNTRRDQITEFLRDLEYGALPSFTVTNEDPRTLQKTKFADLFNSQFGLVEPQILEEYKAFEKAGSDVWGRSIEGHRKVAEGVYETKYDNGRRLWVNYNDKPYSGEGYTVKGKSFEVVEEGGKR